MTTNLTTPPARENQRPEPIPAPEDALRLLVDAVEDYAIFLLSPEGNVASWNRGAGKLKGYRADEILGKHFSAFYTESDIAKGHPQFELAQAIADRKYEEEGWRVRKDGSRFWANVTITALYDNQGTLRGFGKVTRDLTQRKRAETALRESEERFRLMVESVEDYAVFMLTPDGLVASWNRGAARTKGYEANEILGKHVSLFYPAEENDQGRPTFELLEATRVGKFEVEGWRLRKDGSQFWANVVLTAMRDKQGKLIGFSQVTRNLTERRNAERSLREAYADLEQRVAQRTQELSEAKAKAELAVTARERFFSIASHELKTPLASLRLQAQFRRREVSRGRLAMFAPDKLLSLFNDDERQIQRLVLLVENMFDISKITSGSLDLQPEAFDLAQVVGQVVSQLTPMLLESGNTCSFEANGDGRGTWDRSRIEQVITNLLTNAGKYAPAQPVRTSIVGTATDVTIRVADGGAGIAVNDQQRIFDPFERVSTTVRTPGLGLGLFISRQIVEAHGGTLSVESTPGCGTTFIVHLPKNFVAAEATP